MKIFLYFLCFAILVSAQDSNLDTTTSSPQPPDTTTSTTTTTTPTTTTTTTPTTTTTTSSTTTTTTATPTTSITTTTKATTTTKPTTTTPKPPPPSNGDSYIIKDNGTTCITLEGNFEFTITYNIGPNVTNQTTIKVPKPSDPVSPKVDGACKTDGGFQFIKITWGNDLPIYSFQMYFNSSNEKTWYILNTTSVVTLDNKTFPNATQADKAINSDVILTLTPSEISANHSYRCNYQVSSTNVTSTMETIAYDLPVIFRMSAVKITAYNKMPKVELIEETACDLDRISDIVPIAVGCALGGLIICVVIAYIVGRRRRTASYQSV